MDKDPQLYSPAMDTPCRLDAAVQGHLLINILEQNQHTNCAAALRRASVEPLRKLHPSCCGGRYPGTTPRSACHGKSRPSRTHSAPLRHGVRSHLPSVSKAAYDQLESRYAVLLERSKQLVEELEAQCRSMLMGDYQAGFTTMVKRREDQLTSLADSQRLIAAMESRRKQVHVDRATPTPVHVNSVCRQDLDPFHAPESPAKPLNGTWNLSVHSASPAHDASVADLSSTQQTVFVRDDDDETQPEQHPWELSDKMTEKQDDLDTTVGRRGLAAYDFPQADSPKKRHELTALTSPVDVVVAVADEEYMRSTVEMHQQLMTHVEDHDPEEVFQVVRDRRGQPLRLGEGSYASVYLAKVKRPDVIKVVDTDCAVAPQDEMAIKVIRLDELEEEEVDDIRHVVLNEIVFMSNISHPNLVTSYGTFYCSRKNELWVAMEYCRRGCLSDVIFSGAKRRIFNDAEIAKVCYDILRPLHYMSQEGWIHRDVKPENILIDCDWNFKLSDFGLSRACGIDEVYQCESLEGTLEYLAPECFNSPNNILKGAAQCTTSHRSDIYSVGICALVMAGINNRRRITNPSMFVPPKFNPERYGQDSVNLRKQLSSLLLDFVMWCLQDNYTKRPTAGQLLKHPFIVSYVSTGLMSFTDLTKDPANSPRPRPDAHVILPLALAAASPQSYMDDAHASL